MHPPKKDEGHVKTGWDNYMGKKVWPSEKIQHVTETDFVWLWIIQPAFIQDMAFTNNVLSLESFHSSYIYPHEYSCYYMSKIRGNMPCSSQNSNLPFKYVFTWRSLSTPWQISIYNHLCPEASILKPRLECLSIWGTRSYKVARSCVDCALCRFRGKPCLSLPF